jgi:hypothetical protein
MFSFYKYIYDYLFPEPPPFIPLIILQFNHFIKDTNILPSEIISINLEKEKTLMDMINLVYSAFIKVKPNDVNMFFSFDYVLFKFYQLLQLDEYTKQLNYFKNTTGIIKNDVIWNNICHEVKWEYIPSL